MKVTFDTISVVILAGSIQGLFLASALIIVYIKNKIKANLILGLLLLGTTYIIFSGLLPTTKLYIYLPHLLFSNIPVMFLGGPLFYEYINCLTNRITRNVWIKNLHFLPALLVSAMYLPFYLKSGPEKIACFENPVCKSGMALRGQILWILFLVLLVSYLAASCLTIRTYEQNVRNSFSSSSKPARSWYRYLFFSIMLTFLVLAVLTVLDATHFFQVKLGRLIPLSISLSLFLVGYRIILTSGISAAFGGESVKREEKYALSKLKQSEALDIRNRIEQLMREEKAYRETDLSLADMAEELGINKTYLSQVINQYIRMSFYEFVNSCRLTDVLERMNDPSFRSFTILDLAFQAGFNSKSVFNRYFKKATGKTPSQYLRTISKD